MSEASQKKDDKDKRIDLLEKQVEEHRKDIEEIHKSLDEQDMDILRFSRILKSLSGKDEDVFDEEDEDDPSLATVQIITREMQHKPVARKRKPTVQVATTTKKKRTQK